MCGSLKEEDKVGAAFPFTLPYIKRILRERERNSESKTPLSGIRQMLIYASHRCDIIIYYPYSRALFLDTRSFPQSLW